MYDCYDYMIYNIHYIQYSRFIIHNISLTFYLNVAYKEFGNDKECVL